MKKITAKIGDLHPIMRAPARDFLDDLGRDQWKDSNGRSWAFLVFETYRSPERQKAILDTTSNTNAGPWQSAHQFGLALDVAAVILDDWGTRSTARWSWSQDHPWHIIKSAARRHGLLVPIKWDLGHVEHPAWRKHVKR